MIKKSILIKSLFISLVGMTSFVHTRFYGMGSLIRGAIAHPKNVAMIRYYKVKHAGQARMNGYKNYWQQKLDYRKAQWEDVKEVSRATRDFVYKERDTFKGFFPGLLLGALYMKRGQDYDYGEALKEDIQDAVAKNDFHKLQFLEKAKQADPVMNDAMICAVETGQYKSIQFLLQPIDPQDPKSRFYVTDPDIRMLGATKIGDMNSIVGMIDQGYDPENALEVARKTNKVVYAQLLQVLKGQTEDSSLAMAALDQVGMRDFFTVGYRTVKNKFSRMFKSSIGEEPELSDQQRLMLQ